MNEYLIKRLAQSVANYKSSRDPEVMVWEITDIVVNSVNRKYNGVCRKLQHYGLDTAVINELTMREADELLGGGASK